MTELALNILDIVNNSTKAESSLINIIIDIQTKLDKITIIIDDNGKGMSEEFLKKVIDPFSTTRTTRKVGLGIPLFKMASEMSGGEFNIESRVGIGTKVKATFLTSHIDRPPLGDIALTMMTLLGGEKDIDFVLKYSLDEKDYIFDTREIKSVLGDDDLTDITTLNYLKEMIKESLEMVNGGIIL